MNALIRRVLNISPDEDKRVILLGLAWASTIGFIVAGKAARDAIFLSRYDRSYLPLMVAAIAVAVAVAVAICSRLSRVANPRQIFGITAAVAAASMFLFLFRLEGGMVPALYIWVEVANVILGLEFWLMASELVDSRQAKRLFALIAGGGSATAILVGSQLKAFVKVWGATGLLPVMAGFLLLGAIMSVAASRLTPVAQQPPKRRKSNETTKKLDGYLTSVAVVVCAAAIASTLVDYQFKMVAAREIQSEADLAGFFGMFSAVTGFSSLVFQFVLTGRILSVLGIVAGLALLPLGLGASSAYLLFSPVLAIAALAKFSDQTLKFTVHNSGLECLWLPVPYGQRQTVKPWITGTLKSTAEGLSGLATFFLAKVLPLASLSLIVLCTCAIWLFTLVRLKGLYSRTLEDALRSRSLEYSDLRLNAQDPTVVAAVNRSLSSGDAAEQIFALELIRDMPPDAWTESLRRLLREGSPAVQRKILETAGADPGVIPIAMLTEAIAGDASVAEAAMRAAVKRGIPGLPGLAERRIEDPHPGIRALSARVLRDESILTDMLKGSQEEQLAALTEARELPAFLPDRVLPGLLNSKYPQVREAAMRIAATRGKTELIPLILDRLSDPETSIAARSALLELPADAVTEQISKRLVAPDLTTGERLAHVRVLRYLPADQAFPVLCDQLAQQEPHVRRHVPDSLLVISRRSDPPAEVLKEVETRSVWWTHSAYAASESLLLLPQDGAATLMRDHYQQVWLQSLSGLLKLLAMRRPSVPVESCLRILADNDKARLSFVLDLLDSFLPIAERKRVLPLFESSTTARSEHGRRLFDDLPSSVEEVLRVSLRSKRDWEQAISLDYTVRGGGRLFADYAAGITCAGPLTAEVILRSQPDLPIALAGQFAAQAVRRRTYMYSTLEKTIILKSATLFSTVATETLSRVAELAEEVSVTGGARVYREGEPGTALYVVASGSMSVSVGKREIAVLRRGEPIGEVAVLNRSDYGADVTAIENSVLLRIEQDDLFEAMRASTELMQGVIGLLARRVVQVGDLLRKPQ